MKLGWWVGLLLLASAPLVSAQTGCVQQTQAQLLAALSDNAPPGSITPQVIRNVVCSLASIDPAGQIPGTQTNDNALAGNVGEYITSTVGSGAALPLTTATPLNVTSVTLSAGDWTCAGNTGFAFGGSTTVSNLQNAIGTISASQMGLSAGFTTGAGQLLPTGSLRVSVATSTVVNLVAQASFGVSTGSAYGFLGCRRTR